MKINPMTNYCGATKKQSQGTCMRPSGWGTDHPGVVVANFTEESQQVRHQATKTPSPPANMKQYGWTHSIIKSVSFLTPKVAVKITITTKFDKKEPLLGSFFASYDDNLKSPWITLVGVLI
jgi:hypothetical protein